MTGGNTPPGARRAWPPPDDSGDRNGEPSEEELRWEFPLGWALGTIVALSVLCVLLIVIIADDFPSCGPYSS